MFVRSAGSFSLSRFCRKNVEIIHASKRGLQQKKLMQHPPGIFQSGSGLKIPDQSLLKSLSPGAG